MNGFKMNGSAFADASQSPLSGILLAQVKVLPSQRAAAPQVRMPQR